MGKKLMTKSSPGWHLKSMEPQPGESIQGGAEQMGEMSRPVDPGRRMAR
jgi:hypothetical protein